MVFTSFQAETWRPSEESCCGEVGRLQRQQHSTREEEDAQHQELRITQRWVLAFISEMLLSHCSPTLWGPVSLTGVAQWTWTVRSMAGWVSGMTIHPGPGAHSSHQGQRMWPEGPWGGCCTQSRHVPLGPGGWSLINNHKWASFSPRNCLHAHRSPQVHANCKQGHLQQLLLSEHRWRHSKSRLLLAGHLGLLLPVPVPAASPGNRCCSEGEPAAALTASTKGLCALFLGRTNLGSTTLDLLHLGNIRNLEGLFLGSEEL